MNKFYKRIMALMLSLVMMLGCIPSFINEANAIDIPEYDLICSGITDSKDGYLHQAWSSVIDLKDASTTIHTTINNIYNITGGGNPNPLPGGVYYQADNIYEIVGEATGLTQKIKIGDVSFGTDSWFDRSIIHMKEVDSTDTLGHNEYKFEGDPGNYTLKYDLVVKTLNIDGNFSLNFEFNDFNKFVSMNETGEIDLTVDGGEVGGAISVLPLGMINALETGKAYIYCEILVHSSIDAVSKINQVKLNGTDITANKLDSKIEDDDTSIEFCNEGIPKWYFDEGEFGDHIIIYFSSDITNNATITLSPLTVGTKVSDINFTNDVDFYDGMASLTYDNCDIKFYKEDLSPIELNGDDVLEKDNNYIAYMKLSNNDLDYYRELGFVSCCKKITVNEKTFSKLSAGLPTNCYYIDDSDGVIVIYSFTPQEATPPASHTTKKYKANDKEDTTEKITGTGKKGSKRTIVPEEGRKVTSVIVTDKNGNEIEVTPNEDGTFSFIQPASNVDVKVNYKNRLIELTIGSLDASVDDVHHNLDVVPKVVNDRTMLPIRFVAENLGAKVDWDGKDPDTVIITRGNTRIEITLGSDKAKVNGEEYLLDSVAFAENDRTYLPVRFVSEKLNAIVEWNEKNPMDVKIYERQ